MTTADAGYDVAMEVHRTWQDGDRDAAAQLVTDELVNIGLVGTPTMRRAPASQWHDAGADMVVMNFPAGLSVDDIRTALAAVCRPSLGLGAFDNQRAYRLPISESARRRTIESCSNFPAVRARKQSREIEDANVVEERLHGLEIHSSSNVSHRTVADGFVSGFHRTSNGDRRPNT